MDLLLQYAVNGLATGSLYALVALGIVVLYRTARVLNFAHGDLAALGTLVAYTALTGVRLPFSLAAMTGLAGAAAVGALFYAGLVRHAREAAPLSQSIMTMGLALLLGGLAAVGWGTDIKAMPFPLSATAVWRLGDLVVSQLHAGATAVAAVLMAGLYLLVQHTRWGLLMRALSENPVAARLLGVRSDRILAATWAL
ncbi:MAG: branched-chain amino acid ABC transporter permease, partial [Firmicutes bacterium]|nr:branched-chain amino acid ABC transporter permease [Bacillota bacterium]